MSTDERRSGPPPEPPPELPPGWPNVADPSGEAEADPDWRLYRSYPSPLFRALTLLLFFLGVALLCLGLASATVRIMAYRPKPGSLRTRPPGERQVAGSSRWRRREISPDR